MLYANSLLLLISSAIILFGSSNLIVRSNAPVRLETKPTNRHNKIENGDCPDTMKHPLEYPIVPKFAQTNVKASPNNAYCTLITQCSVDRFENLERQALSWNGHLSAAIYVRTSSNAVINTQLGEIATLVNNLNSNDKFQGQLTVSLLFGHENNTWRWQCKENAIGAPLYPINALRNLATAAASTAVSSNIFNAGDNNASDSNAGDIKASDNNIHKRRPPPLLFLVDVDFVPSPGLLQWASRGSVVERCNQGDLIVVPAFEAKVQSIELPTLQYMLDNMQTGNVFQFHKYRFPPGHGGTNYDRWASLSTPLLGNDTSTVDTYPVPYHNDYEPYVILSAKRFVAYDERLRGYGQNKIVQLQWLSTLNSTYHVLPGHFVVATSHERPVVATQAMRVNSVTRRAMARAYATACKEMRQSNKPQVSRASAALLAAAGLEYSFQVHNGTAA